MLLTAEQILKAPLATKTIKVPQLGGEIRIQEMTGAQRAELEALYLNAKDDKTAIKKVKPMIAAMCVVDENGARIFTDAQIPELAKLSSRTLDMIDEAVGELSEASEEAIKKTAKKL